MPVAHSWHPSKRKPLLNLRSFSQCSPPSLIFRRMLSVSRIWRIDVADAKPPKWVRGGTSALRYFSDMANLTGDFCFREADIVCVESRLAASGAKRTFKSLYLSRRVGDNSSWAKE